MHHSGFDRIYCDRIYCDARPSHFKSNDLCRFTLDVLNVKVGCPIASLSLCLAKSLSFIFYNFGTAHRVTVLGNKWTYLSVADI